MSAIEPPARIWILALVAGIVILMGVVFLIRVPEPEVLPTSLPGPSVGIVDQVVIQGTMLRDPTPLFLPTEFNSSRKDYIPREPGGAFAGFPPVFAFDKAELTLKLPPTVTMPQSPAGALAGEPPGAPFIGFGRQDIVVQPVEKRIAYVEIVEAGTGRSVVGRPVTDAHPPTSSVPWQPMEFLAAVDASGLVGPLVPTARSGVDEVDSYFGTYLAGTFHLGQKLAPGFYRIIVGP